MRPLLSIAVLLLLCWSVPAGEEARIVSLSLSISGDPEVMVPVTGGIPFARGVLLSAEHCRVRNGDEEVPAQIAATAWWPDGSVKWVLVDLVLAPAAANRLRLEFGPKVRRRPVSNPLVAKRKNGAVEVTGPGLAARIGRDGRLSKLVVSGRNVLPKGADLVFETIRTSGPSAFPGPSRICIDSEAKAARGEVDATSVEIEVSGPLRVRVLIRGFFRVPGWGVGLPEKVLAREPAERVPFSLRYEFHRGLPLVGGSHQFVFTGEPDLDFITRLGLELPGQGAGDTIFIAEPGVLPREPRAVSAHETLLCAAALKDGFGLIRDGLENRPCLVGGEKGSPGRIDFWPREAGVFDLRRYAREWGVGESGRRDRPEDMDLYARYAARGLAKSHRFVLSFGGPKSGNDQWSPAAHDEPTLLLANPGWYARSGALGDYLVESRDPAHRELTAGIRRYLDYFLTNQKLYRWHGKLDYGFWQTRNGDIHRIDRWDRDYGRWGWSLGDGAGRIGHVLMLEFLRSGRRRYFRAGEAFCRAVYDTSMVHTDTHLENARPNWWTVRGCNHRHNVQPFGGPYIGMRGSYPGGHRILWFLTGDGVIRDGLDLVAQAALEYSTNRPGAFGASGGTDGQGSGALALLFAFETTGEQRYLAAVRKILDKGGLFPPSDPNRLGYGASFGVFLAGEEYLDLTGDEGFRGRFLETADAGLAAKNPKNYLTVLAGAYRLTGDEKYRVAIERTLETLDFTRSLAELPKDQWPGHGGSRRPPSRGNLGRDLPYALAAIDEPAKADRWPGVTKGPPAIPSRMPGDWPRPGGAEGRPHALNGGRGLLKAGVPRLPDDLPFAVPEPFVWLSREDAAGNPILTRVLTGPGGGVKLGIRIEKRKVSGRPGRRIVMAVAPPRGRERVAAFGVEIPFARGSDPRMVQVSAAGAFRVERFSVDQNGEEIPGWLNSDSRTRWPLWRGGGLLLGPGESYRIFKQNLPTCSPLFVDQGFDSPGWLDVTDRSGGGRRGLTARLHRDHASWEGRTWRGVTFDSARSRLVLWFQSPHAAPLDPEDGPFLAAGDLVAHDGWRPPLLPPALTEKQFRTFLDDLDYGENIGLFALRFLFSETHKVKGERYKVMLMRSGIEPREILSSMQFKDGLRKHCGKIGVRYDPDELERTITRVIDHYR